MTVDQVVGFYHPTHDSVTKDRTEVFPEKARTTKQFLKVLEETHSDHYFNVLNVRPLFRGNCDTVERLNKLKSSGRGFIEVPGGLKRKLAYKRGLEAADKRKVYVGFHIHKYGLLQITQIQKACELYAWNSLVDNSTIRMIDDREEEVYSVKSRLEDVEYFVHIHQNIRDRTVISASGHCCGAKHRFGANRQMLLDFPDDENPLWCAHELAVLMYRQFQLGIRTPLFFPIVTGRVNRRIDALRRQVAGDEHCRQIVREAYLNKFLIEEGMPGNFVFDKEPGKCFVTQAFSFRGSQPIDVVFDNFMGSGLTPKEYYDRVLKQQFEKMQTGEMMDNFVNMVLSFSKLVDGHLPCQNHLDDIDYAKELPDKILDAGALVDITNYALGLYLHLPLVRMLKEPCLHSSFIDYRTAAFELFQSNLFWKLVDEGYHPQDAAEKVARDNDDDRKDAEDPEKALEDVVEEETDEQLPVQAYYMHCG